MISEFIRFLLAIPLIQQCLAFLQSIFYHVSHCSFFKTTTKKIIEFDDTGISATVEHQIAEGGFSYIYLAHDTNSPHVKYALKRIICPDRETMDACRSEANVHRILMFDLDLDHQHDHREHIMQLLGIKFDSNDRNDRLCYMLFPLVTGGSLRDEVTKRQLLQLDGSYNSTTVTMNEPRYLTTMQILNIFLGLLNGVKVMHDAGYAHCDIKLENVMLDNKFRHYKGNHDHGNDEELGLGLGKNNDENGMLGTPILMDFGSARSLVIQLRDRRTVLNLTEEAAKNSTISYRAPELFDGGCRHGPNEPDIDGKVDVWSCGCVLYGLMYGTSPFEMEFRQDGSVRIMDCNQLRVLGKIPQPPKSKQALYGYRSELNDLVEAMLIVDRRERPDIDAVIGRVENAVVSCQEHSVRMASFDGITTSRRTIV